MSRGPTTSAVLLAWLLAGALPAAGQQWVGERLCAPQLPSGAEFGSAVAVGADGTIAVGDYRHDAVYLFRRDATSACQSATIQSQDRGSWFGFALASDGNQLLVGAPKSGGTGAAYLVELNGLAVRTLRQVSGLAPGPGQGDESGSAVAIAGGILAIGARGADSRSGRVYVGREGNLAPVRFASSLAPAPGAGAELGQSVALAGMTLVMGAPFPFRGSGSPGAAYVVQVTSDGSPGNPIPLLIPGGLEPEAAFGYAVAVAGERILVGAPLADRHGVDAGAVFAFQLDATGGAELALPTHPGDQLGVAVAADGGNAVLGARYANGTRGAAYLLGPNGAAQALVQSVPAGAQFGFAAAIRGATAVVGAFRENGVGAAYRFDPAVAAVTVEFAAASSAVQESAGPASLQVIAHGPAGVLSAPVTVDLAVIGGTATPSVDFSLATGPYVIPAGTSTDVPYTLAQVQIVPDSVAEGPETIRVQLSPHLPAIVGAQNVLEVTIYETPLIVPSGPLHTSEAGGSAPLEVRLAVQPTSDVHVSLSSSDPGEGIVSPSRLTFTPENWQNSQTVQVVGQDDALCDGNQTYAILVAAASADSRFAGAPQSVPVENADDELACLSAAQTVCTDAFGTVIYTIQVAGTSGAPAQLQDILPPEVSVVSASADRGTATADPIANSVQWTGPAPATITIVAALDVPPGPPPNNRADITYVRDGRGSVQHEVVFVTGESACP